MSRLHHGHACREGFQQVKPEGLAVERGGAEHVERLQEGNLFLTRDVGKKLRVRQKPGALQLGLLLRDKGLIPRPAATADMELEMRHPPTLLKIDEHIHGQGEALDLTHAREVTEDGFLWLGFGF